MTTLLAILSEGLGSIAGFIVALLPAIVVHEMGHMFIAKWAGVWVPEFGIGMPPRLLRLFRWQETEFTLNWLPLGGFARMEGEGFLDELPAAEDEDVEPEEETPEALAHKAAAREHSLYNQPPGKRILIYFGGPLMNILSGWVLMILLFTMGMPVVDEMRVYIDQVMPGSPAIAAGLQSGDVILRLEDTVITSFDDVTTITQEHLEQPLQMTVSREGEEITVSLVPRANPPEGEGAMGVAITGEATQTHTETLPLHQALLQGTQRFFWLIEQIVMLPVQLVQGLIPWELARPLGIINTSRIAYQSIQQSVARNTLAPILELLLLVNVSLGVFNLLPILALDGGRIFLTLIEKVRREPLSPAVQERAHQIAWMVLLALFVVITALDLFFPVVLPAP